MLQISARALVFLALPLTALQAQIPFGDFETWESTDSLFENPYQWSSLNEIHHLLGYKDYTVVRASSEVEGSYAMKAQTRKFCAADSSVCYLVPGMAVLGELYINPSDLSIITPGLPFEERPEFVTAYYQYHPVLEDSFRIVVELSKSLPSGGKMIIAYGEYQSGDVVAQFQPMNLELVYFSNFQPDKIKLAIFSGVRNEPYTEDYSLGSRLILDNLQLGPKIETSTGFAGNPAASGSFQLYPIPASSDLTLQWAGQGLQGATMIQLYDNTGRLVQEQYGFSATPNSTTSLSVAELPSGTYWLRLSGPDGQHLGTRQVPVLR